MEEKPRRSQVENREEMKRAAIEKQEEWQEENEMSMKMETIPNRQLLAFEAIYTGVGK